MDRLKVDLGKVNLDKDRLLDRELDRADPRGKGIMVRIGSVVLELVRPALEVVRLSRVHIINTSINISREDPRDILATRRIRMNIPTSIRGGRDIGSR